MENTPRPVSFTSSKGIDEPRFAPKDYRPHFIRKLVYDNEVNAVEPMPAWRELFAGGSSRPHYILKDPTGKSWFVEQSSPAGDYDVYGPDYGESTDNAHDAFWLAERQSGMYTDPNHRTS